MVGGNLVVKAVVPKKWRAWPTLTLKFFVMSVDFQGNIHWPTQWDDTATALNAVPRLCAAHLECHHTPCHRLNGISRTWGQGSTRLADV